MYTKQTNSEAKSKESARTTTQQQSTGSSDFNLQDQRSETATQSHLQTMAHNNSENNQTAQLQTIANNHISRQTNPIQQKSNNTGLPDNLKSGIETLSGLSMDDVNVHKNSDKPAQLNAHAYARGSDIFLANSQEKHLPHEAWHVVQQKQGRVKPTTQLKENIQLNNDSKLEREADVMGAKASQLKSSEIDDNTKLAENKASSGMAIQRAYTGVKKLRIGIISANTNIGVYANQLPLQTYVWILSNKPVDADALDNNGVTRGHNRATPKEIINANQANVINKILLDEARSNGEVVSRLFQSGAFEIPRSSTPTNRNEYDYSFLRLAALESYNLWHGAVGANLGWPAINSNKTLLETIDSDISGITGSTNEGRVDESTDTIKTDWLAEAGVYQWDWTEIKDEASINNLFTTEDNLDTAERDKALKLFAKKYLEAEKIRRSSVSAEIFKIYFPEPATRISPAALTLLSNSAFTDIKITRGQQIGHKRESVGLIAGLVHLDTGGDKAKNGRSKSKLKFNPAYVVKTGLGNRKASYKSVFIQWYNAAKNDDDGYDNVNFSTLDRATAFDQSYINPATPGKVLKWHNDTLKSMQDDSPKAGEKFFHPK